MDENHSDEQCADVTTDATSEPNSDPVIEEADAEKPGETPSGVDNPISEETENIDANNTEPTANEEDDGATVAVAMEENEEHPALDAPSDEDSSIVVSTLFLSPRKAYGKAELEIRTGS